MIRKIKAFQSGSHEKPWGESVMSVGASEIRVITGAEVGIEPTRVIHPLDFETEKFKISRSGKSLITQSLPPFFGLSSQPESWILLVFFGGGLGVW
jgi:hypothetical protein